MTGEPDTTTEPGSFSIDIEPHASLPLADAAGVDIEELRRLIARVLTAEDLEPGTGLTLLLAANEYLRELNREYRETDEPTDVLAFGASEGEEFPSAEDEPDESEYLGDIVVSLSLAREQALAAGIEPVEELHHLVVHGVLHLLGYDHEEPADDEVMRAQEESFLGSRIHAGRGAGSHAQHG